MYEHRKERLLSPVEFIRRFFGHFLLALVILAFSLGIGVLGYHYVAQLPWIDALLNASMILTGMGPVNELHTDQAKVFAACYALFSGIMFLGVASVLVAPFAHRLLHRFHLEKGER
jgi:hypothetical protein